MPDITISTLLNFKVVTLTKYFGVNSWYFFYQLKEKQSKEHSLIFHTETEVKELKQLKFIRNILINHGFPQHCWN